MIKIETQFNVDDFSAFQNDWNRIYESGSFEPSLSFCWTQALLKTHLKNSDKIALITIKRFQEVIGFVPLVIRYYKIYLIKISYLFPISEFYNTHSGLLIKDLDDNILDKLTEELFNIPIRWDVFYMRRMVEGSCVLKSFEKQKRIKIAIKKEEPTFYLKLENDYKQFLKNKSRNFRKYINKSIKKIKNDIKFVSYENYTNITETYKILLQIEDKTWKHKIGTSISKVQKQKRFYWLLCKEMSEEKKLSLHFLLLDEIPVAYNLGIIENNKYYYLKTSFDEKYREKNVSNILRIKLIEYLIKQNVYEIDFTGEPYRWQTRWTKKYFWQNKICIYNNTLFAFILLIYEKIKKNKKDYDETLTQILEED